MFQNFGNLLEKSLELFSKNQNEELFQKKWTSEIDDGQLKQLVQKLILNKNQCLEKFENVETYYDLKIEFSKIPIISDLEIESTRLLNEFLQTYFHLSQKITFDQEYFSRCCDIFSQHISEEYYKKFYFFTPLYDFDTDFDRAEIDEFTIEKITSLEFDRISSIDLHEGDTKPDVDYTIKKVNCILVFSVDVDPAKRINPKEFSSIFLHALRLTSPGSVSFGEFYGFSPLGWQANYFPGIKENQLFPGKPYFLKEDHIKSLKEKFQLLKKLQNNFEFEKIRYLIYSIRRFDYVYRDTLVEDNITDLMISLETMLNNQPYEVTDKTSLRAAMILEEDDNQKRDCQKFIKKCYGIRSEIVHGKERKEKIKEIKKELSDDEIKKILSIDKIVNLLSDNEIDQIKNKEFLKILSKEGIKEIVPKEFKKELSDDEIKIKLENYVRKAISQILKLQIMHQNQDGVLQKIDIFTLNRNENLFG